MDALDVHRLQHAEQTLAKGRATIAADVKDGSYWVWSGYMLKVATQLKNGDPGAAGTIRAFAADTLSLLSRTPLHVSAQNDLMLLLLSIDELEAAREISRLETQADGAGSFDVALNAKLLTILSGQSVETSYKPTASEACLLEDLDSIATRRSTDLSGTDTFWKGVRKKRFANTMYEHTNIFHHALSVLQRI